MTQCINNLWNSLPQDVVMAYYNGFKREVDNLSAGICHAIKQVSDCPLMGGGEVQDWGMGAAPAFAFCLWG